MKVLLVFPRDRHAACSSEMFMPIPSTALATLAALTPPEIEIEVVNEAFRPLDLEHARADLVGLSVLTLSAPRAWEIAGAFRRRSVPVVAGGVHATFCPDEALEHADAVLRGEAEGVWAEVLRDAAAGRLKRVYQREGFAAPEELALPRWDVPGNQQIRRIKALSTARGCPMGCEFCTVSAIHGRRLRGFEIEPLVEHIRLLLERDRPHFFFFTDDNPMIDRDRAMRFFERITPLRIKWFSFASLNIAGDDALLAAAARSGCKHLFLGFESLSDENLAASHKALNRPAEYVRAIESIHRHGISIQASFIFGFDEDQPEVFRRTMEFCEEAKVEQPLFNILTPLPGTRVRERMEAEGRIIDEDWAHYDMSHVVFEPRHMSREELQEGHNWAWKYAYSPRIILGRLRHLPWELRFYNLIANFVQRGAVNRMLRHLKKTGHYPQTGLLL